MSKNQFRLVAAPGTSHEEFRSHIQSEIESARGSNGCALTKLRDDLRVAAGTTAVCIHVKGEPNAKQTALLAKYSAPQVSA